MIHIHGNEKCSACNIAKNALRMYNIEFEEKGLSGIDISGGLPIIVNTSNNKKYNGWPGSIERLKEVLDC